jgi:hypothetical protein
LIGVDPALSASNFDFCASLNSVIQYPEREQPAFCLRRMERHKPGAPRRFSAPSTEANDQGSLERAEPRRRQPTRDQQPPDYVPTPYRQPTSEGHVQRESTPRSPRDDESDSDDPTYIKPRPPRTQRDMSEGTETREAVDKRSRTRKTSLFQCPFAISRPGWAPCTVLGDGRRAAKSVRTPNDCNLTCR